jgi:hypothetical protein
LLKAPSAAFSRQSAPRPQDAFVPAIPPGQDDKENNMNTITRKLAVAGAGLLGVVGLAGGVAAAQSSPASTTPRAAVSAPAATSSRTATPEVEKPGIEEPGDKNLPGGGHADPAGQTVDHQFQGVE